MPTASLLTAAIEAGAKAFHDAHREKKFLTWESSTEQYREGIRALVRPAVEAAVRVALAQGGHPPAYV
ncbi:MAG: hypothetical protein BGP06_12985 [Rhizobiales bacterium 65-9]|nr:hypothetical protein [Hyphomicrobiales bacterium]OJY38938.1 MAG: hypothetical protein BGP06_12985 [Rhizobiales bacterium 65-9]